MTKNYVTDALSVNEKILLRVKKHPICLYWPFIYNLLFLIIVVMLAYEAASFEPKLIAPILSVGIFPFCLFFFSYLKWVNEEVFLTTHRVIHANGIINKLVSDSSLEKVNDVVLSQTWLGRVLDFGDLQILTASDIGQNSFVMINSPVSFKTAMLNQKQVLGDEEFQHPSDSLEVAKNQISNLISGLDKLRQEGVLTEQEFIDKKTQLLAQM